MGRNYFKILRIFKYLRMSEIINYQSSYYEKLLFFYKKTWNKRVHAEDYLIYRLFKISDNPLDIEKNLLAITDDDEIVGCNLFLPAKAMIFGEEHTIYWSNDTFVEEKYRGDLSMELVLKTNKTKRLFGFGMTPINRKIQKKLKTNFIAETNIYFVINRWVIKIFLYKLKVTLPEKTELRTIPDKIIVKGDVFELVKHAKDVSVPNNGYWNKGKLDIEMKRDFDYFNHRFFNNYNTYYFYQKKDGWKKSYFILRKIVSGKGIPAISLVDFRYDLDDFCEYLKILHAVNKFAVINRIPMVTNRSTILDKKIRFYPFAIRNDNKSEIVTNIKNILSPSIFITSSDSDADLMK